MCSSSRPTLPAKLSEGRVAAVAFKGGALMGVLSEWALETNAIAFPSKRMSGNHAARAALKRLSPVARRLKIPRWKELGKSAPEASPGWEYRDFNTAFRRPHVCGRKRSSFCEDSSNRSL